MRGVRYGARGLSSLFWGFLAAFWSECGAWRTAHLLTSFTGTSSDGIRYMRKKGYKLAISTIHQPTHTSSTRETVKVPSPLTHLGHRWLYYKRPINPNIRLNVTRSYPNHVYQSPLASIPPTTTAAPVIEKWRDYIRYTLNAVREILPNAVFTSAQFAFN